MTRKHPLGLCFKGVLLVHFLLFGSVSMYAQNDSTSVGKQQDDMEFNAPKTYVDFTPEDVQLQKRYRPTENDVLFPTQWWRRMYIGAGAGVDGISDNFASAFQPQFFGYLGYKFSPIHGMRAKFTLSEYSLGTSAQKAKIYGFGVDYLANLSNFALGYNQYRTFEFSTVLGAGMLYSSKPIPNKVVPYAQLGLRVDARLSSNFDVFLEPYVGLQGSVDDVFANANPESWNLQYGIRGGAHINFNERYNRFLKSDSVYRQPFIDASIGLVGSGRAGGITHRTGVGYEAALGMWLNPVFGLRGGLQAQSHHWMSRKINMQGVKVIENSDQVLAGVRAEVMVNPLNIIKSWRDKQGGHDFDLNLLGGVDFGATQKANVTGSSTGGYRSYYYGLTAAMQVLYRINDPGTYIYVEPRLSTANYNVPNASGVGTRNMRSPYLSMNVGTRVYMNQHAFTSNDYYKFSPHWWMGAEFGGVKWQRSRTYTTGGLGFNPTFGVSIGYDWKPLASFRAQLMYQRMYETHQTGYKGMTEDNRVQRGTGLFNSAYNEMDLRLSYMLNLSTVLQGYNADRRMNLWWTVGPSFSYNFSQKDTYVEDQKNPNPELKDVTLNNKKAGKASPGVATSLMAALKVNDRMDVTAEAYGQYNFLPSVNPGNRGRLNSVKYGVSVGTRYHFEEGESLKSGNTDHSDFFFDGSIGWTTNKISLHNAGTKYTAAIGKWINPLWGLRVGINTNTLKHSAPEVSVAGVDLRHNKTMVMAGARGELLLNPLNFFNGWRNKAGGHDFDLNFSAGAELGYLAKNDFGNGRFHNSYYGVTTALQFLYRINNPGTYIYLEPRYLSTYYTAPYTGTKINHTVSDNMFSMNLGVRTYLTDPSFVPANSHKMLPEWWVGADFGSMYVMRSSAFTKPGGLGMNPSLTLSAGYDYKPLLSFRAQLAYQHYSDYQNTSYSGLTADNKYIKGHGLWKRNYNIMDLRFAYMLNINNFFQGYDSRRKFNFWMTAGPGLSFMLAQNNDWVDGQTDNLKEAEEYRLPNDRSGKVSPTLHASFMTSYKVSNKVDLTAEALGQLNLLACTNPGNKGRVNTLKYSFALGARYHLEDDAVKEFFSNSGLKPWNKGWMLEASYGWTFPEGAGARGGGSSMQLSLGRWFTNVIGLRAAVGGSQGYWKKADYAAVLNPAGETTRTAYSRFSEQMKIGGRVELLLNPLNLLSFRKKSDEAPKYDMNMSLGFAFGGFAKVNGAQRGGYTGFTAAVTGLYRVSNNTQLFVEPRIETQNHSSINEIMGFRKDFSDNMFSLNVGARVSRPGGESKESRREVEPSKMSHRGWWLAGSFGGSKMNQTIKLSSGGLGLNPSFTFTSGYDLNRLHGFRAQLAYDIHSRLRPNQAYSVLVNDRRVRYTGSMKSNYQQFDIRLQYMLNVSNLWTGYDKRSKFNAYWSFGPSLSTVVAEGHSLVSNEVERGSDMKYLGRKYSGEVSFGLSTSALMTLAITNQWDATAEVMGQYHFNRGYMPENHHKFLNGVKINFSLGARYNF